MSFETEYDGVWSDLQRRRLDLYGKRADLEAQLRDVNTQINHLGGILSHLSVLAGVPDKGDIASMGITDAVRWIMEKAEVKVSAQDVRDRLSEKGYDLSTLSAPMASIYKILARLASEPKPEITREKDSEGKVYYQWIKTETDVPF